ncbi:unnamed protein product [Paramecium sonneborni]|uniref:Uncharacterized protein n=1 Tax=Paramecium sonneborni TaxID=65129 RepID=A0A8S1KGN4_9CILI|nr:unnamed protein product [Paramecium sonneborni]
MVTYQKQSFTEIFIEFPPCSKTFNTLYYSLLLLGMRMKDSFSSYIAFLEDKKRFCQDGKEKQWSEK